jgi:membrane dipeptidase
VTMYDFSLSKDQEQRARDLHSKAVVVDGLTFKDGIGLDYPKDLERMRSGGISAVNYTVAHFPHGFLRAIKEIERDKERILGNDDLRLARSVDDIHKAKKDGKIAVVLGFQDTKPIEDDVSHLMTFSDLGVKIVQLTYNSQNLVGTGCCERSYGGLTYFGVEVVDEMNRLGIVVDLSHCCDETTMDAIEASDDPVLFSHSSVRTLCDAYGRNKTDEQIKALAEKGGVMGICTFAPLVKKDRITHAVQRATVEDVLDHIDYVARLVGPDYVGFGTDMVGEALDQGTVPWYSSIRLWRALRPDVFGSGPSDVYDPPPIGLERHSEFLNLTRGLVARGYSDREVLGLLGGNFLRVFRKVWKE